MDTESRIAQVRRCIEKMAHIRGDDSIIIMDHDMHRLCQAIISMFEHPTIPASSYDVAVFLLRHRNCESMQDLADIMMKEFDISLMV